MRYMINMANMTHEEYEAFSENLRHDMERMKGELGKLEIHIHSIREAMKPIRLPKIKIPERFKEGAVRGSCSFYGRKIAAELVKCLGDCEHTTFSLETSVRTQNGFDNARITFVRELVTVEGINRLLSTRQFGIKCWRELDELLFEHAKEFHNFKP